MIRIRRIYEPEGSDETCKVLVDRLWPRGISKEKAGLNLWMKEIAPSGELRIWYHHDPDKWEEFKKLYHKELVLKESLLNELRKLERTHKTLVLLYSARDKEHNNAVVLRDYLINLP